MTYSYRNPWFKEFGDYGPEFYTSRVAPAEYRGFQIFHRHEGMWDLVKGGVCLTQRAGRKGVFNLADALLGDQSEDQPWLVERAREIAASHGISFDKIPA